MKIDGDTRRNTQQTFSFHGFQITWRSWGLAVTTCSLNFCPKDTKLHPASIWRLFLRTSYYPYLTQKFVKTTYLLFWELNNLYFIHKSLSMRDSKVISLQKKKMLYESQPPVWFYNNYRFTKSFECHQHLNW